MRIKVEVPETLNTTVCSICITLVCIPEVIYVNIPQRYLGIHEFYTILCNSQDGSRLVIHQQMNVPIIAHTHNGILFIYGEK